MYLYKMLEVQTSIEWLKADQWLPGNGRELSVQGWARRTLQRTWRNFEEIGMFSLDFGDDFTDVYKCQNLSNCVA